MSASANQKLIETAGKILFTDGVGACTADEVAKQSGVAKTTLYRHFGSIDALVFAAVTANVTRAEPPDTGTLRGDLKAIHQQYLKMARRPQTRDLFIWMIERAAASPENRVLFDQARIQPGGPTVIALQRAIARGEVEPTIDINLAMQVIQGPLISSRIVDNRDVSADELEQLLDMTMRALGVPSVT